MNGGKRDIDEKSRIFVDTDMYSLIDGVWNGSQCRGRNFTVRYGENTVSVNFDDVATQSEPAEQFCNHLVQFTESTFTDEEGIESADAIVSYDEGTEQYSIELSLKTNGKVGSKKIEEYKIYLSKTYADVILIIDGEVM